MAAARLIAIIALIFALAAAASAATLTVSLPAITPPATQGTVYSGANGTNDGGGVLYISGGAGPYTCSKTSGTLPTGLTVSEVSPQVYPVGMCTLNGTPTGAGDFTFTITATDSLSATASQSISFQVQSSSPPVISAVSASSASSSSETITWTTDVSANSQVFWGQSAGFGYSSTLSDTGGVTSHSVTITGLLPGYAYSFGVASQAVSGSAEDYNAGYYLSGSFTAGTALTTGSYDFIWSIQGPHNVLQSYPMYDVVYAAATGGTASVSSWKLVITGIPTHSKVHWPDEQDLGFAECTVSTTTTTDDTCTFANPQVTQFEIITNVGGTTPTGSSTLTVTATTNGGSLQGHTLTWTMGVGTSSFPSGSPGSQPTIPLLSTWQSNMTGVWPSGSPSPGYWYAAELSDGTPCSPGYDQCIDYYDGEWVYQQIAAYTGNTAHWTTAANNSRSVYVDYVTPNGGGLPGYWNFPHGLYTDCRSGSGTAAASCTALGQIANNIAGATMASFGLPYADALNTREGCYQLGARRLDYDAGGSSTKAQIAQMLAYCIGDADQIVNATNPFEEAAFDGLLSQALIECYDDANCGSGDPRIPPAIKAIADHLWSTEWMPWSGVNGSFIYSVSLNNEGFNQPSLTTQLQNLNLLIVPLYGWTYLNTGLVQYQQEGDTIWYAGVNDAPANGLGFSGKNFSQQYRWSFDYVTWRTGSASGSTTIGSGVTLGSGVTVQ